MAEYIEREALLKIVTLEKDAHNTDNPYWVGYNSGLTMAYAIIVAATATEAEPVKHGRWELTVHSFYRDTFDESCELCVYIVANCSECSGNHPNSYQVYSKTLYAPEDATEDFRFDQEAEETKALEEFKSRNYCFAYYCPNCGAKMMEDSDG